MADIAQIAEKLSQLTVLEAAELAKMLEEKWGVSAAPAVSMTPQTTALMPEPVAEQTEFAVVLLSSGDKKVQVIKEIRAITNLGLVQAKEFVEAAPKIVKEAISRDEAEKMRDQIEAVGGKVEIR